MVVSQLRLEPPLLQAILGEEVLRGLSLKFIALVVVRTSLDHELMSELIPVPRLPAEAGNVRGRDSEEFST